jgi:hypothetical protein
MMNLRTEAKLRFKLTQIHKVKVMTRRVGVVDAVSYSNGGVAASTIDEMKTTDSVTAAETKVGEEKGETPMKKSVDP